MKRTLLLMFLMIIAVSALAQVKTAEQNDASPRAATNDPGYVIGPEDVLNIAVWKEPDFSGSVPVRPDGAISLSLLGDVAAAGKTPTVLADDIAAKLKKYIDEPRVTVIVTAINSRKVFLLGEINKPGPIALGPNMTVLQAVAAAGGPTAYANSKKAYVLRTEQGKQVKLPFNYKEALRGGSAGQDIVLKAGDTIVMP